MKRKKHPAKKHSPPLLDYHYITHHIKGHNRIRVKTKKVLYIITQGLIDRMLHPGSPLHQKGVLVVFEDDGNGFGCTPLKELFNKIKQLKKNGGAPKPGDLIPGSSDFPAYYYYSELTLVECERRLKMCKNFVCLHQSVFVNRKHARIAGDETTHVPMKDGTQLPVAADRWKELFKGYPQL